MEKKGYSPFCYSFHPLLFSSFSFCWFEFLNSWILIQVFSCSLANTIAFKLYFNQITSMSYLNCDPLWVLYSMEYITVLCVSRQELSHKYASILYKYLMRFWANINVLIHHKMMLLCSFELVAFILCNVLLATLRSVTSSHAMSHYKLFLRTNIAEERHWL